MKFSDLVGKTITSVDEESINVVHITCSDGSKFSIDTERRFLPNYGNVECPHIYQEEYP